MKIALIDRWVNCKVKQLPGCENSNASTPEEGIDVCSILLEKVQCTRMIQIYSLTDINDPQLILQAKSCIELQSAFATGALVQLHVWIGAGAGSQLMLICHHVPAQTQHSTLLKSAMQIQQWKQAVGLTASACTNCMRWHARMPDENSFCMCAGHVR